jgi:spartin
MSSHNDPKLLYAVNGVKAYHIANGEEDSLTPSGPQTLSLLMVPTSLTEPNVATAASTTNDEGAEPEQDFYLHLHLPPELDLPLPATTQIYHQPPTSYLIPRWDLGPQSGAFTRIEFPSVGSRPGVQEDVDTFETILAQCTSFLERRPAPKQSPKPGSDKKSSQSPFTTAAAAGPSKITPASASASYKKGMAMGKDRSPKAKEAAAEQLPPYNPGNYRPGEGYAQGSHSLHTGGRIVLVDEEDGSVIGELGEGYQVLEDAAIQPGSKEPVEISLPQDGSHAITVLPASQEYIEMEMHPSFKKSTLVSSASKASRLIVTTSDLVARGLQTGADQFTKSVQPAEKPMTFTPTTHSHIRRINQFSDKAAGMSSSAVHTIGKMAQNVGAAVTRRTKEGGKGFDKDGNLIPGYKPGLLNKSLMAFNTVADGIEQAGRNLLVGTQSSVTTVVSHRWGAEAGQISDHLGGGFKNVGLVYIDVTGVSRRAILKHVAKGMVVGKVSNGGGRVMVGGGDGGSVALPPDHQIAGAPQQLGQQPQPANQGVAYGVGQKVDEKPVQYA